MVGKLNNMLHMLIQNQLTLKLLRRNPPGLRVVVGQNYLHLIASFCVTASNILSEEIFSNNTKHRKQILKFH